MKILLYSEEIIILSQYIDEIKNYLETFGYSNAQIEAFIPKNKLFLEEIKEVESLTKIEALKNYALIFCFSDTFFNVKREDDANELSGVISIETDNESVVFTDFIYNESLTFLTCQDVISAMEKDLEKFESGEVLTTFKRAEKLRSAIRIIKKYFYE